MSRSPEDQDLLSRLSNVALIVQPVLAVGVVVFASGTDDGVSQLSGALFGVLGLLMAFGIALIVSGRLRRSRWDEAFTPSRGRDAFNKTVIGLILSTVAFLAILAIVVVPEVVT